MAEISYVAVALLAASAAFAAWAFWRRPGERFGDGSGERSADRAVGSAVGSAVREHPWGDIASPTREPSVPPAADVPSDAGVVEVTTDLGRKGSFRLLLPRLTEVSQDLGRAASGTRSRVLLVHSDPALVAIVSRVLAARGHEVVAAATPSEARLQAACYPGEIDVLLEGIQVDAPGGADMPPGRGARGTPLSVEGLADVVDRAAGSVPAPGGPGLA